MQEAAFCTMWQVNIVCLCVKTWVRYEVQTAHTHTAERSSSDDGRCPSGEGLNHSCRYPGVHSCRYPGGMTVLIKLFSTITDYFIYVTTSISTQSNLYARKHFSRGSFTGLFFFFLNIVFVQIFEKEPKLRCLPIHPKLS